MELRFGYEDYSEDCWEYGFGGGSGVMGWRKCFWWKYPYNDIIKRKWRDWLDEKMYCIVGQPVLDEGRLIGKSAVGIMKE